MNMRFSLGSVFTKGASPGRAEDREGGKAEPGQAAAPEKGAKDAPPDPAGAAASAAANSQDQLGRIGRSWTWYKIKQIAVANWIEARVRFLRRLIRGEELFLLLPAVVLGMLVGSTVAALRQLISAIHHLVFGFSIERQWMQVAAENPWRLVLVPVVGGLLLGFAGYLYKRLSNRQIVDAIEANALHGGRMSLTGSLVIVGKTLLSIGSGGSVGIEAAITQLGAALFSWTGRRLQLSRHQLRVMVACGAAAAISAAFNAPLAGVFYALELVLGNYVVTALAPVAIAAIAGMLVSQSVLGNEPIFYLASQPVVSSSDYALSAVIGIGAAALGVAAMRMATMIDAAYRRVKTPDWLRPAIGGLLLGLVATEFPYVLGSGHGGIEEVLHQGLPLLVLAGLVVAKSFASAVSIGSGFTGGLFSASLFLGSLYGAAVGTALSNLIPALSSSALVYALIGMGAVAASIVGAPITMILLIFETTQEYAVTMVAAIGVVVAALVTRRWFGYSFATWRFHLKGVELRGAQDVGRLYELQVREILDRDVMKVPPTIDMSTLASLFLFGRKTVAFVVDEDGVFLGVIDVTDTNAAIIEGAGDRKVAEMMRPQPLTVRPTDRLSTAVEIFDRTDFETVAVVSGGERPRLLGCVHEADVHRRYFAETERMRREEVGYRE